MRVRDTRVYFDTLRELWKNCEKRLLASSCPTVCLCLSVCPSVYPSAWNNPGPTGQIFMQFDIWVFFENLSE